MARSFNQFNGMGNLAADPEIRDLGSSGRQVCKLRVMFNDSYRKGDEVVDESFGIDVNVFGDQQVKYLGEFGRKGDKVLIADGTLKIRKYERREGGDGWATEIQVGPFKGNVAIQTTKKEREERDAAGGRDRDDDRGGSRGGGSRGRDDDRGGSRGGSSSGGGRDYDDRGSRGRDDRGSSRGGGGRGGFDPDMDDDVPF